MRSISWACSTTLVIIRSARRPRLIGALALLEAEAPDAALLDENLNGRIITPVAIRLARKKVPFTIISGHVRSVSDEPFVSDAPRLQKPVTKHQLATAFADMQRAKTPGPRQVWRERGEEYLSLTQTNIAPCRRFLPRPLA